MPIVLTVNREQFVLRDADAISRLRTDIEDAVRTGGRLIVIGDQSQGPEVLITPSTAVRIDILTPEEDDPQDASVFIDFDQY